MEAGHEVIAASFAAWNAQDRAALCACLTEDVAYHVPESVPYGGTWHGHAEVGAFADRLWTLFGRLDAVVEKLIGHGDRVIARGHHVTITPDGVEHRVPFVNALSLRDGRICDVRQQLDSGLVMLAIAARLGDDPAAPAAPPSR